MISGIHGEVRPSPVGDPVILSAVHISVRVDRD